MTQRPPKRPEQSKHFEALVLAVACGKTVKAAAEDAGCKLQVAYSLSRSDEFKQRLNEIRQEALSATVGILSESATKAANKLVELLDSEDEKIQLAAATKLLSTITPITELHDLRQQIAELREQLTNSQPRLMTA